ncbi:hypothetical protein [Streptomyces brasiliensis]|uniref:Uncharacterized protein n=1 Tax=Streptomyces brasiliensis TaxID=1954 RepID=A0A917P971_9ACTN|nr:hypothetical protein [Streptomyces brasiliensis]GGJ67312.1 hypothetical protein GCM10010121_092540 [Streptomyces brasiliensis]
MISSSSSGTRAAEPLWDSAKCWNAWSRTIAATHDDVTGALIEALDDEDGWLSEKELIDSLEIILLAGQ